MTILPQLTYTVMHCLMCQLAKRIKKNNNNHLDIQQHELIDVKCKIRQSRTINLFHYKVSFISNFDHTRSQNVKLLNKSL